jgi:Rps23 Pro-64 3,4-dihydroxylase Tpa1-like proline 4-hydroxylase
MRSDLRVQAMARNYEPLFVNPALLQQAEQLCKQRLRSDPRNRDLLRSLAEVYRKLGKLPEAGIVYEQLFQLDPADQEAGYLQALFGGNTWPAPPEGMRAAPFVLLKDFLPRDFHDALIPLLVASQNRLVPATIGHDEYTPEGRQTLDFPDDWEGRQRFKDCVREILSRVTPRLHVPPVKLRRIELAVRAYLNGHFYKMHMDTTPKNIHGDRVVSFVYFFHRVPRRYEGGELLLFETDVRADKYSQARFSRIVPEDNAIILFPSNFYHSVLPVRCPGGEFADSRFVLNGFVNKVAEPESAVSQATA